MMSRTRMKPDLAADLRRADRCVVVGNHLQNAERPLKRLNHSSSSPRVLSWALPLACAQLRSLGNNADQIFMPGPGTSH